VTTYHCGACGRRVATTERDDPPGPDGQRIRVRGRRGEARVVAPELRRLGVRASAAIVTSSRRLQLERCPYCAARLRPEEVDQPTRRRRVMIPADPPDDG
jgi:hypothetical protein